MNQLNLSILKNLFLFFMGTLFLYGCGSTIRYNTDKDLQIQQSINDQLFSRFKNDAKVEVLYVNNKMVIIGYARDDSIKQKIQAFTSSTFNYKTFNEVQILQDFRTQNWRSANDVKIENEILSEFWFMKRRINVRSLQGRIYLMGIVSYSENARVKSFVSKLSNVSQVFTFFDLIEDRN